MPAMVEHNANTERQEHCIRVEAETCRDVFSAVLSAGSSDTTVISRLPQLFSQSPQNDEPIFTLADLNDDFDQFLLWAGNIGVFAADHDSLDYRLREAIEVRDSIAALLYNLSTSLREGT